MAGTPAIADLIPRRPTLTLLRHEVQNCRACDLFKNATQAVFGEGASHARVVFIGEQPGDQEDRQGHPFVGPAGKILGRALEDAGIDRAGAYVTNAVKHFKFEERGKRRIHKQPNAAEVKACNPWLEAEMRLIKPQVIVCLGATAAQALLGREHRLTKERGKFVQHPWAPYVTSTIHPSAILRAPDDEKRRQEFHLLVEDLKEVRARLDSQSEAR
jgi:DNA polymerase